MRPQSAKNKGSNGGVTRVCRRCKSSYPDNSKNTICEYCREHCVNCGINLVENNVDKSALKRHRYICKVCAAKAVRETRDKDNQQNYDLKRTYGITKKDYDIFCIALVAYNILSSCP